MNRPIARVGLLALSAVLTIQGRGPAGSSHARADGMVVAPKEYKGSLEERAQEAILIFQPGDETRGATEDLILKIQVRGDVEGFAWVVPFPSEPVTAPEDPRLFEELHHYVQARLAARSAGTKKSEAPAPAAAPASVEVLSRKIVGSYDVAVVRENKGGALNHWLAENGYKSLPEADDVIGFYRKKTYVFACVKVSDAARARGTDADLHPLRFSFPTGGRDGIFFPIRLTGLQSEPFDVNLYVFYNKWLNDRLSRYGFVHRGFALNWRDYDGPQCVPNAGKSWSDPAADPYLKFQAHLFPTVTTLFQKLHPGERYYLTNLQAFGLKPRDVRDWSDDLWLFPYYTDRRTVPHDARKGGPAATGYPGAGREDATSRPITRFPLGVGLVVAGLVVALFFGWFAYRDRVYGWADRKLRDLRDVDFDKS